MLDAIGLGSVIASLIYSLLAGIGIIGLILLIKRKLLLGALLWTSVITGTCNY